MSIVDESFLDAFEVCTKDSDPQVRTTSATMMGNKFVWSADPQNQQAIEILTGLLDDSDRSTRYAAVYYGLSTVRSPAKELVEKMLATILDDREINYYGRVIGGIRRNKRACVEVLKEWMDQSEQDSQRALKAYEIYQDVTAEPLPQEYAKRFAGQKSDAHEAVVAMCFQTNPISKEELQKQFLVRLRSGDQIQKVLDFYIIETREAAAGMFVCANLADRNAIREALTRDNVFQVAGYMHGRIGPAGSGWINSLKNFRERNKPNRVALPAVDVQVEAEKPEVLRVPGEYPTIPAAVGAAKDGDKIVLDASERNKPQISSQESNQYKATLPNGVTVQLVGLCKEPVDGAKWWKPGSSEMPEPAFEANRRTPPMQAIPTIYTFLARAQGGEDISMKAKIYEGNGLSTKVASDGTALCYVKHMDIERTYHKDAFEKGPIEIGVAQGQWIKGRGVNSPLHIPRSYLIGSSDEIVIQPPRADNREPDMVTVLWAAVSSHDYEFKLICKLKDGRTRELEQAFFQSANAIEMGGIKNSSIKTIQFSFDRLTFDQIVDYEFFYRKFDYARFNDVAFQPNVRTDVHVGAYRVVLLNNLKRLALAIRMYADDRNGSLPEKLGEIKDYMRDEKLFSWALENVEYLGKGVKFREPMSAEASRKPMAYYKTQVEKENGTAVVFLDGHAEFISGPRLQELGIMHSP